MKISFFHFGRKAESHRPPAGETCHNCHAAVSTTYCGECGQKAAVHIASTHEFLHHFIGHYIALEGKLWRTLGYLLAKPGQLTVEYMRGRRGQFIDPLRLLLTVSVLAFLVLKWEAHHMPAHEAVAQAPAAVAAPANEAQVTHNFDRRLFKVFASTSDRFALNYGQYQALPEEVRSAKFAEDFLRFGPTVMLCLIPLIAGLLKIMHLGTGWRYGEHIVFAMHLQTLNLLALIIMVFYEQGLARQILYPALFLYFLLALRKVYGGGWAVLLLRTAILAESTGYVFDWLTRIAFMLQFV